MFSLLFIIYFFTWNFHSLLRCGGRGNVTALQGGYGVFAVKLWEDVALSLVSIKRWH